MPGGTRRDVASRWMMRDSWVMGGGCLRREAQHFQQGQAQVADGVQDAMQGGLIDDLPYQDGLIRLLPAQGESAKAGRPLRPQAALRANAVAGWHGQHGSVPLLQCIRWTALRVASFRL